MEIGVGPFVGLHYIVVPEDLSYNPEALWLSLVSLLELEVEAVHYQFLILDGLRDVQEQETFFP